MDRTTVEPDSAPGGHTMVFLGGLHRSGTSLLFRLLRDHPQVSGFANTGAPEDEGQHLQSVYPPASRFGGEGRFGFAPGAHLTEVAEAQARTSAAQLFAQWSRYWDLDRPVLIEKSPPNIIRMRYLQSLFPGARFVMITRHPLDVALASRKRVGHQPIWSLLRHWIHCHDLMAADGEHIDNLLLVRYEDLVRDPDGTLQALLSHLELPPAPTIDERTSATAEVSGARSDRYHLAWQGMRRNPAYRPYTRLVVQHFESGANRHGYSLRHYGAGRPVERAGA
jgi:hypothetical protein